MTIRRGFFVLVQVVLLTALIAGVAYAGGEQEEAAADDEVVLTWGMWAATETEEEQWQELADDVTREHPNITVELETTGWNAYWTRLQTQLASGTQPDIIAMQSLRALGYYELGGFQALTPFIEEDPDMDMDDFDDSMIEALSYEGDVLGLPYDAGPRVMFYNVDLFEENGVDPPGEDTTWEEFVEISSELTYDDNYGFAATAVLDQVVNWIASAGGTYYDTEAGRYDLTDPGTEEGMQFFADLWNEHEVARPIDEPGNENFSREQFYTGTIGMINEGPWQATNIRANADFEVGMAPIPVGPEGRRSPVAGSGFAMSAETDHPEEAYLAIKTITSSESLSKLAEWGRGFPARDSATDAYYEGQEDIEGLEWIEGSLENAFPQLGPSKYQEFQTIFNDQLESLLFGETDDAGSVLESITRRASGSIDIVPF
ncbi:MAG: ABC transporter substrate-binding protein [Spirochaetota bacterium]